MKLRVEGIEEIEITDPKGVCKLAALPALPMPRQGQPVPPPFQPTPQLPTPFSPTPGQYIPGIGDVAVPHTPHRAKWGVGGPMIQQAAQETDPDKWEKNWQARMIGGEDRIDGHQYTP